MSAAADTPPPMRGPGTTPEPTSTPPLATSSHTKSSRYTAIGNNSDSHKKPDDHKPQTTTRSQQPLRQRRKQIPIAHHLLDLCSRPKVELYESNKAL
ncbi:hypothetical protein AC578_4124 [Pseudocercospora eumusae]|uniref:Uncharacterized protein n=1 Tax=Pseudocercospora eumusae TaxID=321146 RepID=A0A139HFA9_9PEZI|nr:hypothetical protein AC578_4124 [Pseudocercospora eumusae]